VNTPSAELVSVVIPCYNAASFIGATLDSVLAQTYRQLEVIVVDDCSKDASVEIIRRYVGADSRVTLIQMERNAGAPAGPRNRGVRAARGDWIAFLDADDLWHSRKLEHQMAAIKATGARMCSTSMKDLLPGQAVAFSEPGDPDISRITLSMQLIKYRTPTSSIVVRRDLMLVNPFNEDLQFKAREDTDCFIRMHEYMDFSTKVMFPFVLYRVQEAQISGNKLKMVGRHLNMLKKYRLRSGAGLGLRAYFYTFTHFLLSVYYRSLRKEL